MIQVSTLFPNHFLNLALEFVADRDILQPRLQWYVNQELPDIQDGFTKGDQIANIHWILEKAREFQKNICFIDYAKAFDCVDHNKLENSQRDGNTRPPYLLPEKSVCRSRSNG